MYVKLLSDVKRQCNCRYKSVTIINFTFLVFFNEFKYYYYNYLLLGDMGTGINLNQVSNWNKLNMVGIYEIRASRDHDSS